MTVGSWEAPWPASRMPVSPGVRVVVAWPVWIRWSDQREEAMVGLRAI